MKPMPAGVSSLLGIVKALWPSRLQSFHAYQLQWPHVIILLLYVTCLSQVTSSSILFCTLQVPFLYVLVGQHADGIEELWQSKTVDSLPASGTETPLPCGTCPPPWRKKFPSLEFFKSQMDTVLATDCRWPCLSKGLDQMASRGLWQPQPFCDSVTPVGCSWATSLHCSLSSECPHVYLPPGQCSETLTCPHLMETQRSFIQTTFPAELAFPLSI